MKYEHRYLFVEILEGVLLVMLGVATMLRTEQVLDSLTLIFGILAVITGIADIMFYIRLERHTGFLPAVSLVSSILSIMLGSDPQFCVMHLPQAFVSDVLPWTAVVVWLQSVMMIASALWRRKTMVKGIALLVVVAVPAYLVTTSLQLSHSTINLLTTLLTVVNYVIVYKIFS